MLKLPMYMLKDVLMQGCLWENVRGGGIPKPQNFGRLKVAPCQLSGLSDLGGLAVVAQTDL